MHEGNRLEFLIGKCGKSLTTISEETGISRQTIYNYFKQEYVPRKKLLTILNASGIETGEFWTSELSDPAGEYRFLKEKVRDLEQMNHDKEMIIKQQQELIELLKRSKKN